MYGVERSRGHWLLDLALPSAGYRTWVNHLIFRALISLVEGYIK